MNTIRQSSLSVVVLSPNGGKKQSVATKLVQYCYPPISVGVQIKKEKNSAEAWKLHLLLYY